MNIFKIDKILNRLDIMIDNAIAGKPIENTFDETKMSALETKLSHFLAMTLSSKVQLEEEKLRINELVSDISHQTKTPIANMLLYTELLDESNLPEKDSQCVKALISQAEKLNFLISSLVKISRLETGIIAVCPIYQRVQPLIDLAVKDIKSQAMEKNIKIICTNTDVSAVFDLKWTTEAIYNILDNAVKYSDYDEELSISVTAYELFCRIDITDNGIGISEEETAKIFGRFYRSIHVSDVQGVGIGLYLARQIVSSEGGYIKVKSQIKKGSTFSVFLSMK